MSTQFGLPGDRVGAVHVALGGGSHAAPRRWRRIVAANLGWLAASNGLGAVLSLVYVGIVVRTLGIEGFGRFALITGAAQALTVLFGVETWKIVVQYGQEHELRGDAPAMARLIHAAVRMEIVGVALGIASALAVVALGREAFGMSRDIAFVALGYAVVQLLAMRSTPTGLLRLHDKFGLAAVADSVQPIGRMVGTLLALWFSPTLTGFLVAYAIVELLTAATYWLFVHFRLGLAPTAAWRFDWGRVRHENDALLRSLWSTNLQSRLMLASRQAPLFIVGSMIGPAAAGAFRLALQLANALSKLSNLIMRAAFPEILRSARGLTPDRMRRLTGRILMTGVAAGVVLLPIVAAGGSTLLMLLAGQKSPVAYGMLLWLTAAGCADLIAVLLEPILLAVRRAGAILTARGAAVLAQLCGAGLLVPLMGAYGASASVLVGAGVGAAILAVVAMRYAHLPEARG